MTKIISRTSASCGFKIIFAIDSGENASLQCGLCGRTFWGRNRRQHLEHHFMTHTNLKPYQCPFCQHRTNRSDNLKTHIKSKHTSME